MNAQLDSLSNSQSSTSVDITTLKQRRYQYKAIRRYHGANSHHAGSGLFENVSSPFKSMVCESHRACPSPALNPVQATPLVPVNLDDTQDRTNQTESSPFKERLKSEPAHPGKPLISPKNDYEVTKQAPIRLTPLRIRSDQNFSTPRGINSQRSIQGTDYFDTLGNDSCRGESYRRLPMTPDSKRLSTSGILQRDLLSYRAARQMAKSPIDFNAILSQSYREVSKSQDSIRLGLNQSSMESERLKVGIDSERKVYTFGLEKFNRKNLEVLEEDESPSEENERKNSAGVEQRKGKLEHILPLSNLKARRKEIREGNSMRAAVDKETVAEVNNMKPGRTLSLNEKLEQLKVEKPLTSKGKTMTPMRDLKFESKRDSKDMGESRYKVMSQERKKLQNETRTTEAKLKYRNTEEDLKIDGGEEKYKGKVALSITLGGPQSVSVASDLKKLKLNNWTKSIIGPVSNTQSSKSSPKLKTRELSANNSMNTTLKKGVVSESPKKKMTGDNKSISVIPLKMNIAAQVTSGSGGSTANTVSIEETEHNLASAGIGENNGGGENKMKEAKEANKVVSIIAASNKVEKGYSKTQVRNVNLLTGKESQGKRDMIGIRLESTESEKTVKPPSRERDIFGKQGYSNREILRRKESGLKASTESVVENPLNKTCVASTAGSLRKNLMSAVASSPKAIKKIPDEEKIIQKKEIVERYKDKITIKPSNPSGFAIQNARRSVDIIPGTVNANNTPTTSAVTKLKSPVNQLNKGMIKISEHLQKDKKAEGSIGSKTMGAAGLKDMKLMDSSIGSKTMGAAGLKDMKLTDNSIGSKTMGTMSLKEMRLMKNAKEARSAKQSREWKNSADLKLFLAQGEQKGKGLDTSKSIAQISPIKKVTSIQLCETMQDEITKEFDLQLKKENTERNRITEAEVKVTEIKVKEEEKNKVNHSRKNSSNLKTGSSVLKNLGLSLPLNKKIANSTTQSMTGKGAKK